MDPGDAALIEASLAAAAARAGDPAPLVYARLFAAEPTMRDLFVHDASGAVRGEMLARAFDTILDFTGRRDYADHLITAECAAHDSYGVPPAVFISFFAVIAETLRDLLGDRWTAATDAAWQRLLAAIAATLAAPEAPRP